MADIQRHKLIPYNGSEGGQLEKFQDGPYVLYEDHIAMVKDLEFVLECARPIVERLTRKHGDDLYRSELDFMVVYERYMIKSGKPVPGYDTNEDLEDSNG